MDLILTFFVFWVIYKFVSKLSTSTRKPPIRKTSTTQKTLNSSRASSADKYSRYDGKSSLSKPAISPLNKTRISTSNKTYSGPLFAQPGEKGKLFGFADKSGPYHLDGPYAIIDLETSGFNPPESRILEIAILKIDKDGKELDRFETLINPETDNVGRTDIHGIDLRMLKEAPTFHEASGRILELIENSIIVAHNARFEENFLAYQFNEAGFDLNLIPSLDTLWLARNTIDLENYKLETVVSGLNEQIIDAHTALGDVVAVAKILPKMLSRIGNLYYPIKHPQLPKTSIPFKAKTR